MPPASRKRPPTVASSRPAGKRIRSAAVRVKPDPAGSSAGTAGASSSTTATASSINSAKDKLRQRFLALFSEPPYKDDGISNKTLKSKFPNEQPLLVQIINELLGESRLMMSKGTSVNSIETNEHFYTLVAEEVAQKYQGLDVSARMVLQVIEKAGDYGIWTRDIRMATNIQQQALNKIFKSLEQRSLIKPVKSVAAKTKKLYMLYELTPRKELTGGVWYSGLDFDHEFISELRTFVIHCIHRINGGQGVTLNEIKQKMTQANVSRVELGQEEIQQLISTLIYDYKIEESPTLSKGGDILYIVSRRVTSMCDFKWWDCSDPDFHFRPIQFEDGVRLGPHEPHHHTG